MTHLSLPTSKKIFELIGKQEVEVYWEEYQATEEEWKKSTLDVTAELPEPCHVIEKEMSSDPAWHYYPAYDFQELIRILPLIGEKKGWEKGNFISPLVYAHAFEMVSVYLRGSSESEGMAAVDKYISELL